ncbi:hypothetical protein LguiB_002653 [Lonicera macranthoides]
MASRALKLFRKMLRVGLVPNATTFIGVLNACNHAGLVDEAERVFELSPNAIGCYVHLSNMNAAGGQWDKVSKVRENMRKRGFRKDPGCSTIEHEGVLHEFKVGDKSHSQIKEITSKLSEMRERLKCVEHVADTSQVLLYLEDEKQKEAELENHSERLAIAFGLINVKPGSPICIMKNLLVCNDCHTVTKLLSKIYGREIIARDNSQFHHFKHGSCSCGIIGDDGLLCFWKNDDVFMFRSFFHQLQDLLKIIEINS